MGELTKMKPKDIELLQKLIDSYSVKELLKTLSNECAERSKDTRRSEYDRQSWFAAGAHILHAAGDIRV